MVELSTVLPTKITSYDSYDIYYLYMLLISVLQWRVLKTSPLWKIPTFWFFSFLCLVYSCLVTWVESPCASLHHHCWPTRNHHSISTDFRSLWHGQHMATWFYMVLPKKYPRLQLQNCRPIAFLATLMFAPVSSAIELLDSDEERGRTSCRAF